MNTAAIEVPDAIRTWVDDVAARGGAAVLFGSRADNRARPDSDWDIAVVGDAVLVDRVPYASFGVEVQVFHVTPSAFEEQRHVYPGIVYEVAHNGVLLAGEHMVEGIVGERKEMVTDVKRRSDEFGHFIGGAFDYAWDFIAHAEAFQFWDKFTDEWSSDDERAQAFLPERSADGAEFTVKALCLAVGSDYARVHDMDALAERVPAPLRGRVRALNGHTHADHMAGYSGEVSSPQKVYERVVDTMSLLADMAGWESPMLPDRARSLLRRLNDVERDAATLDKARCDEPVVRTFKVALGAWQAQALDIERGHERGASR